MIARLLRAGRSPALHWLGIVLLSLVHGLVVWHASRLSSPTIDEFAHLPAGLSYLRRGQFQVYPHNPPLPRLVAALAAQTQSPPFEQSLSILTSQERPGPRYLNLPNYLALAEAFEIEAHQSREATERYLRAFAAGRIVIAIWSAATIPVLFAWGQWWFGRAAGWTAAALWAACPTVIGHAGLTTTDVPAASLSVLAAWCFARWLHRALPHSPPVVMSWRHSWLAGATLGAALLTKFSVSLLVPLFVLWTLARALRILGVRSMFRAGFRGLVRSAPGRQLLVLMLTALMILNAGYGFEDSCTPLDSFEFASQTLTRPRQPGDPRCEDLDIRAMAPGRINRFKDSILGMLPAPIPAMYLVGIDRLKWEAEGKYDLYLRGQWRRQGFWDYYLYGLLVKWPLGTWAIAGLAVVGGLLSWRSSTSTLSSGPGVSWVAWLMLAGTPLAVLSLLQDVNLGLRYALPAFPFLFLLAGTAAASARPAWFRIAVSLALVVNVISVARVHPHELAYFHEAVGGPEQGRRHLIDSNLDWGQDLFRLQEWIRQHPEWSDVRLAWWGPVSPELTGLRYDLAPRDLRVVPPALRLPGESELMPETWGPQAGRFAVSVNFERGMGFRTPIPSAVQSKLGPSFRGRHGLTMMISPPGAWSYFQHFAPRIEHEVGFSVLLYDLSAEEVNRVRQTLGLPRLIPRATTSRNTPAAQP